jgi:hypothetical protein
MGRMNKIVAQAPLLGRMAARPEDMNRFLAGDSNGELLLHGLYDYVLQEPVPEELIRLLGDADETD